MSSTPTKLSELIAFVNAKSESISETPDLTEVNDFSNGCHDNFQNTYGEDADVVSSPPLMKSLLHLCPITSMEDSVAALTVLESEYSILAASEFSHSFIGRTANSATLNVEPLEKLVFSTVLYNNDRAALAGYGQNVPAQLRPFTVAATLQLCCILSNIWGFFTAYEDPTIQEMLKIIDDYSQGRLPTDPSQQKSPLCSRVGKILGWNCGMACVDDLFKDRADLLAASSFDLDRMRSLMQSVCRAAMAMTAESFSASVEDWRWSGGITFDMLSNSFDAAFQRLLQSVAPQDEDNVQLRFSLQVDTRSVRRAPVQKEGNDEMHQPLRDAQGESYASRVLNVRSNVLGMLGLQRPEKRRRLNVNDPPPLPRLPLPQPPQPPQPPLPLEPLDQDPDQVARRRAIARERAKMQRDAERRRHNRRRNANMPVHAIWDRFRFNIRALRGIVDGRDAAFDYENDNPDSENDDVQHEDERADAARMAGNVEERVEIEIFWAMILNQHVDALTNPPDNADDSVWRDYDQERNWMLNCYLDVNRQMFLYEATRALNPEQYADHMKAVLQMETHFQLQRSLFETFPNMIRERTPHVIANELISTGGGNNQRHFIVRVDKVGQSRLLTDLVCRPFSASHNVRRSLINAFPGQTVCIAIVFRGRIRRSTSRLSFMICRSISHQADDTIPIDASRDPLLDNVTVRLTASRYQLDSWGFQQGDLVHLLPFCNVVTNLRELKSAHAAPELPDKLQRILFGTSFQAVRQLPDRSPPRSRAELDASLEPIVDVRARVNRGCLSYVDALPHGKCGQSQRRALLTTLGEMGEMHQNSSSLSLILGPPGCGKSWTIALLCMALMHHSRVGHVRTNATYPTVLTDPPKELRCSQNRDGLRILITCPSNFGVDEVAKKLRDRLPMGDGSTMRPYIVRIGRLNYDYQELDDVSLHRRALQYDLQVYNVPGENEDPRRHPSTEALNALMSEACIFLCTNATAAGPMLSRLGVHVSAVIVDEAAHASEQESLMSIMANVKLSQDGRVHAVLVGDMMQLGPVFLCSHPAIKFVDDNRSFLFRPRMIRQFESLFDRLHRTDRCKTTWLMHHYRSHPDLAAVTLGFMYYDILMHPRPRLDFERPFNTVTGPEGLQPLTIIDTRLSLQRFEGGGRGQVSRQLTNDLECQIVNEVLYRINENRGNYNLEDEIIVCSPYLAQTEMLRTHLNTSPNFCSSSSRAPGVRVSIDTVDACQGSERSIAIVSLTRSNRAGEIGFLRDNKRLNVAFTRAKNLLVLVGDFSTMTNVKIAQHVYQMAADNSPRTSLQFYEPTSPRYMDQRQVHQRNRIMR